MMRTLAEPQANLDGDVVVEPFERHQVTVSIRGRPVDVRMTRVQGLWLASAATLDGPSLGHNHSPFLAVRAALDPLGGQLVDVLAAVREIAPVAADHRSSR